MRSRLTKLAVAAVLTASLPALAVARDCDHDGRTPFQAPPHAALAARPTPFVARHAPDRWRDTGWRDREIALLRVELRQLDLRRADFYARHHGRGQVRRFERWYAARRAELERRWYELSAVAWR